MSEGKNTKRFDLEDRTYQFARRCRDFVNQLTKTLANIEYGKQLIRSSSSPAGNYIEANESLSRRDFAHKIMICRKEAKESQLWLRLCEISNHENLAVEQQQLLQEASELTKIFSAILEKCKV